MLMDKGMDKGDMLLTNEVEITPDMTTGELHDKLAETGAKLMLETLDGLKNATIKPIKQNDANATYASKLDRETEVIDWSKTSKEIVNKIRGLNPWPTAYTTLSDTRLKLFKARLVQEKPETDNVTGKFIRQTVDGFLVATGDGVIEILQVQPASKKMMPARTFIQGLNIPMEKVIFGRSFDGK